MVYDEYTTKDLSRITQSNKKFVDLEKDCTEYDEKHLNNYPSARGIGRMSCDFTDGSNRAKSDCSLMK